MGAKLGQSSQFGTGFNPLQPYEYIRIVFLLIARMFPKLRSEIIVVGQK
jgi:hypothetical protein